MLLIIFCLFVTTKYHLRFNEGRKFHELSYSDFNLSSSAEKIDKKFYGLNWITPEFNKTPSKEINLINEIISHLKDDNRNKMLMTNYSFFFCNFRKKAFFSYQMAYI